MSDSVYSKEGRSIRVEIEAGRVHRLALQERGTAIVRGTRFECETLSGPARADSSGVVPIPEDLVELLHSRSNVIERATITSGAAHHEMREGPGHRQWSDRNVRMHVSIVNHLQRTRCELDHGGSEPSTRWLGQVSEVAQALDTADPELRVPSQLTLEPAVSAATLAFLWTTRKADLLSLAQVPRSREIDGVGEPVQNQLLTRESPPHPWFRPSFRVAPRRIPHGLDLVAGPAGSASPEASAIASSGSPWLEGEIVHLPCLVRADGRATRTTLQIDLTRWDDQIEVVGDRGEWFPLLAGVWGRRLLYRARR